MTAAPTFAQRTILLLIGVGGLSFLCAVVLIVFGQDLLPTSTVQANAYSQSAIGHMAFVETLRALGIRVLVSRSDSAQKAGPGDLLIVAEPPAAKKDDQYLRSLLEADRVLLILPKWVASTDFNNRRWAREVYRLPPANADDILHIVASQGSTKAVQREIDWKPNRFGGEASLAQPQLMTADGLTPIIDSNLGVLLGEADNSYGRLWVLSDADLISNQGLKRGDNALIAVGMVQALLSAGGSVIVDEVIHGFRRERNVWRALLEFPIIIITINAFAAVAVLLWAATGRFGSPLPIDPPLKAGKTTLIGNAAGLLLFGGHAAEILGRYLAVTFADVARRVHAPAQLAGAALDPWLERIGKARGVGREPAQLRREAELATAPGSADERRLLHVARDLYRWKREMLHGSGDDSLGRRTAEATAAQGGDRAGRRH
ncbi:MAG TPA: DUF4350 domain-containing protein [Candidatus Acidoferrum sp.]|nr:DUF4350 domain-containing protein [Candidatus Acidoferrum sp.]